MLPISSYFDPNKDIDGKAKAIFNFQQRNGRITYTFSKLGDFEGSFVDWFSKSLIENLFDPYIEQQPTVDREKDLVIDGRLTLSATSELHLVLEAQTKENTYLDHYLSILTESISELLFKLEEETPFNPNLMIAPKTYQ